MQASSWRPLPQRSSDTFAIVEVNEIGETSCGFWSEGVVRGINHERTFSNWMGGRKLSKGKRQKTEKVFLKIVKKTSWKSIHLNLSAKGRTTTEEIVLFQFTLLGRCSNTWDHRVWGAETQEGQRGSTNGPRTPDALASSVHLQSADLLSLPNSV